MTDRGKEHGIYLYLDTETAHTLATVLWRVHGVYGCGECPADLISRLRVHLHVRGFTGTPDKSRAIPHGGITLELPDDV